MSSLGWQPPCNPDGGKEAYHMNKDELEGKYEKAKGYVKEKAGEVTEDRDLEAEGAAERGEGHAKEKLGEASRKAGEAGETMGEKIRDE